MHKIVTLLAAAVLLAPAQPPAARPKPVATYRQLKYPPLHPIKVPEPARFELANGMIVYLVEDRELPMISVSATVRTGTRLDPPGKTGLAAITAAVMRTGGAMSRKGDDLDSELDRLGASVETWMTEDTGGGNVSVLKEDIDQGLAILADVLQHPAFPEDKIELEKIQHREGIARRNDDPGSIAWREFNRLIYGKDSSYGRQTEYATIDAIRREDLVAFHKQYFQPENVILGAWGDFKAEEMRAKIEKALGGWQRGGRPRPAVPEMDPAARNRAGLYFIHKDDVNQSNVLMGFLIGRRDDPDFFALEVMNAVLGSGFASRLFANVRSREGLAYSVGSGWDAGWDRPGIFVAAGGTKSETTLKIIGSIKREIANMSQAEVSDSELARAKDSILKGFAFEFDLTAKIVRRLMSYDYYGYPRDFLQRYQAGIAKVTKADVLRVAKQHLTPERLAVLVLGNQKEFEAPLSELGQVTPIDITIPKD